MGMCLRCGTIMNDAETAEHICDPADIPAVGKQKKPTTTESDITPVVP